MEVSGGRACRHRRVVPVLEGPGCFASIRADLRSRRKGVRAMNMRIREEQCEHYLATVVEMLAAEGITGPASVLRTAALRIAETGFR